MVVGKGARMILKSAKDFFINRQKEKDKTGCGGRIEKSFGEVISLRLAEAPSFILEMDRNGTQTDD